LAGFRRTRHQQCRLASVWGQAAGDRYSALTQINRNNVRDLKVVWTYNTGDAAGGIQTYPTTRNLYRLEVFSKASSNKSRDPGLPKYPNRW
jgi:hypothetical protein